MSQIALTASNVGGISETTVELEEGVSVLVGRNATNRTSFLKALRFVLGSSERPLKSDAKEGFVELEWDNTSYERHLVRRDGDLTTSGSPYLEDPDIADLFAYLLEDNPARRAIERGDDLRELIVRPVDVEAIETEIATLREERREVLSTLEEIDDLSNEQERIEIQRAEIESDLETVEADLQEVKSQLEDAESQIEGESYAPDVEDARTELQQKRARLEEVKHEYETIQASLDSLKEERQDVKDELETMSGGPGESIEELDRELERLRSRRRDVESTLTELQTVIGFNEDMLEAEQSNALQTFESEANADSPTDQLLVEETAVTCWTCGSDTDRSHIEETLEEIRSIRQQTFQEKRDLEGRIAELQEERRKHSRKEERFEQLQTKEAELEAELQGYQDRLESLTTEREQLREEIDDLKKDIQADRDDALADVLSLQREEIDLEFERDRLQRNLTELDDSLERIENRLEDRETLEERKDEIDERIEALRSRVDRIEEETVESFNGHMESILDLLEYHNIERIWIERKRSTDQQGVSASSFELHIVRQGADGAVYEDTVEHLSESEREVVGLIFALSGFLVHEVYEELPFLLLDSLEAIDAPRINDLIGYFEEWTENLVVALLPEDAQGLPDDYHYISEI